MSAAKRLSQVGIEPASAQFTAVRERSNPIDLRFRTLVGEAGWQALPEQVRRRFSKRLGADDIVLYRGRVVSTELSRLGRMLAFLARAIGGPLPLINGATGPAVVAVTEDAESGGQFWTRTYAGPRGFPQVIHSTKRFRGQTGLEEYVGYGLGMRLRVFVEGQSLVFRSSGYFLELAGRQLSLPGWLMPGTIEITHTQEQSGEFCFQLTLEHAWFGRLISQTAFFRDV